MTGKKKIMYKRATMRIHEGKSRGSFGVGVEESADALFLGVTRDIVGLFFRDIPNRKWRAFKQR